MRVTKKKKVSPEFLKKIVTVLNALSREDLKTIPFLKQQGKAPFKERSSVQFHISGRQPAAKKEMEQN